MQRSAVTEEATTGPGEDFRRTFNSMMQSLVEERAEEATIDRERLMRECPWNLADLESEQVFRQVMSWYILDRDDPASGKTPLRARVEREVSDPALRQGLLEAEHPVWRECEVLDVRDDHLLVRDAATGEMRNAEVSDNTLECCEKGTVISGPMHRWGDRWRFNGILQMKEGVEQAARRAGLITPTMVDDLMARMEKSQVERIESNVIRDSSTLRSVLNKYPWSWIDGMSAVLGVDRRMKKGEKTAAIAELLNSDRLPKAVASLPRESREALAFIVEKGGTARLGDLEKRFDCGTGLYWVEKPPKSAVGALRLRGLVVVGRMAGPGGKMYRMAMIPRELRDGVAGALRG